MKYFGTVKSFDEVTGHGSITPEIGGENLQFERGAASWYWGSAPAWSTPVLRRASYERPSKRRNLETI